MPDSPSRLDASLARRLSALKYTTPELIFHRIEIDHTCAVLVIGGDGEGAYEWVIVKDGAVERHSDKGYGLPFAALRDGLTECWPPFDSVGRGDRHAHQINVIDEYHRLLVRELEAADGRPCSVPLPNEAERAALVGLARAIEANLARSATATTSGSTDAPYTLPDFPGTPDEMSRAFEWLRSMALKGEQPALLLLAGLAESSATGNVIVERCRQIHVEGWTHDHDDEHAPGDLGLAGACYAALGAAGLANPGADYPQLPPPMRWPWLKKWWKPKNPRRDLVRAGALILAEIERIDRHAKQGEKK